MGIELVRECAKKFAHLNGNQFKVLNWMCFRALDTPNGKEIPIRMWFADWFELAHALGWEIPPDPKHRKTMRRNVSAVCRELVAAGAIQKRSHPSGVSNSAYYLVLEPGAVSESEPEPVDNTLPLDLEPVHSGPRGVVDFVPPGVVDFVPPGVVDFVPPGVVGNVPPPINRNEDRTEDLTEEKTEDDTDRRARPPDRARPVDNPRPRVDEFQEARRRAQLATAARADLALGRVAQAMATATREPTRPDNPELPPIAGHRE